MSDVCYQLSAVCVCVCMYVCMYVCMCEWCSGPRSLSVRAPCASPVSCLLVFLACAGPWNLVAFTAAGAYMGANWAAWEDSVYESVNDKRVSVGYKPIVRKESP